MTLPRLLLLGMGGTIASSSVGKAGATVDRGAADLLAALPDIRSRAEVVPVDICQKPSRAIDPEDMSVLAHRVTSGLSDGFDAVLVTHGTDTMEETAYALALQLRSNAPVVLTGAMRALDDAGSDAKANLLAAVAVALSEETAALGPVIVMDDEIHVARWVTKARTIGGGAFASPSVGPAGAIVEGTVRIAWRACSNEFVGLPPRLSARVEIVFVGAGSGSALVDAAADSCDGIVVAGTGGGHVPPGMVPAIAAAGDRGIDVVVASRTIAGPVLERSYIGEGSEQQLFELGATPAGSLPPLKARLRLLVALSCGMKAHEVFPSW
jgi:L-asparaginase